LEKEAKLEKEGGAITLAQGEYYPFVKINKMYFDRTV
jgi:hypothetical protein